MFTKHLFFLYFAWLGLQQASLSAKPPCLNWQNLSISLTKRNDLLLEWRISETYNTAAYRIERSVDNVAFEVQGEISGLAQLNGEITYRWDDPAPLLGKAYYRIRQIKKNAPDCLSPTIDFTYIDDGIQSAEMYPNPCSDYLHLNFYASRYSELTLVFINEAGVEVRKETISVVLGLNSQIINIQNMPTGFYTIDLKNKELAIRRRLFILNS